MIQNKMYVGVDYYPEHWPRERWEVDARGMRYASFDVHGLVKFASAHPTAPTARNNQSPGQRPGKCHGCVSRDRRNMT